MHKNMREEVATARCTSLVKAFRSLTREMVLANVSPDQITIVLKDNAFFDFQNYMATILPSHEAAEIVKLDDLKINGIKVIRGT